MKFKTRLLRPDKVIVFAVTEKDWIPTFVGMTEKRVGMTEGGGMTKRSVGMTERVGTI